VTSALLTTLTAGVLTPLLPSAALWPWIARARSLRAGQRIAAAFGLGVAVSSSVFFLYRLASANLHAYAVLDPLLWIIVGIAGLRRAGSMPASATEAMPSSISRRERIGLGTLALVLGIASTVLLVDWIDAHPHGRWDAWAIWNLRAKFLAAPPDAWRDGFDPLVAWSQRDYPLLLSLAVARGWVICGEPTVAVPIALAVATALTVGSSLLALRGTAVAAMGLSLLVVPQLVLLGAAQMADVPLAFFAVLAASVLAAPAAGNAELVIAGAAAASAAWTKNEGMLVAVALPAAYLVIRSRRESAAVARQAAMRLGAGMVLVLAVLALFEALLAPASDLVAGVASGRTIAGWLDAARIRLVTDRMARAAVAWGGWPLGSPVWLLALLVLAPRGARSTQPLEPAVLAAGALLVIQLATFFAVYVMTPYPVAWHIDTSWPRLIAQMWPTLVWAIAAMRRASWS
jgi:hypothetical protein